MRTQRYISNELTHFVGRSLPSDDARYELLVRILREGWLTFPPHRQTYERQINMQFDLPLSSNEMVAPGAVCFCDIPTEDLGIHIRKYGAFGLAFLKPFLVARGANPVFYVERNSGAREGDEPGLEGQRFEIQPFPDDRHPMVSRAAVFDELNRRWNSLFNYLEPFMKQRMFNESDPESIQRYSDLRLIERLLDAYVLSYIKFFDSHLSEDDERNYYFEREWRVINNIRFTLDDVSRIILPHVYSKRLREDLPEYYGQLTFTD
jgi:hypothetical protein